MYEFRPMTADDLPLVKRWLAMPHVAEWWGEPDEQFGLVSGDLTHPAMDQYIVATDDRPFGYLQCYQMTEWNTGFGPQPDGTRGIDQMIGEPDMIERGHGSALIRVVHRGPARGRHAARRHRSRSRPMPARSAATKRPASPGIVWSTRRTAWRCS